MKLDFDKLKELSTQLTEKSQELIGIKSFETISEATKEPTIVIHYLDGTTKSLSGKEISKGVSELIEKAKSLQSPIVSKYQELEDTIKENLIDFSYDQITTIQSRLKSLEEKLKEAQKEKVKVKTITITEPTHDIVKKYCVENNLKISEWVDGVLLDTVNVLTYKNLETTK